MKRGFTALILALAYLLPDPAAAAAGTTCLCRAKDSKTFEERTVRHHRWACDYHYGYLRGDPERQVDNRPVSQTCSLEEVVQWKVYRCVSIGCTYAYARSTDAPNTQLNKIETAPAKRNP